MNNNQWQPMETIPDVGKFLVFIPNTDVFEDRSGQIEICERFKTGTGVVVSAIKNEFVWKMEATHWMNLPEPPAPDEFVVVDSSDLVIESVKRIGGQNAQD